MPRWGAFFIVRREAWQKCVPRNTMRRQGRWRYGGRWGLDAPVRIFRPEPLGRRGRRRYKPQASCRRGRRRYNRRPLVGRDTGGLFGFLMLPFDSSIRSDLAGGDAGGTNHRPLVGRDTGGLFGFLILSFDSSIRSHLAGGDAGGTNHRPLVGRDVGGTNRRPLTGGGKRVETNT